MIGKIVFGTWPLSGDFGPVSLRLVEDVVNYAYARGISRFDVAPSYGNGFAEMALGMIFSGDQAIDIYTKCGNHPFLGKDFAILALERSLENSFARLRSNRLKGVFLHNPRSEILDFSAVMGFLDRLKTIKLVELTGISGAKGFDYRNCLNGPIDIYQQDANLLYMHELNTSSAHHRFFFARSPLATGILSGRMSSQTVFAESDLRSQWLKGDRLSSLLRRVEVIKRYLGDLDLASVSRRFLLFHDRADYVVAGISKKEHVDHLLLDFEKGPLDVEMVLRLKHFYDNDFFLPESESHLGF